MLHVITGAPCSGKSTYIKEHAKDGDMIVDMDDIALVLGVPDHDYSKTVKPGTLWDIRKALIADAVAGKDTFDSWIVDTMLTNDYPEDAEIITLEVDKETALERARTEGRPQRTFDGINKYFADEKGKNMKHLFKTFELKVKEADNGIIEGYFSTYDKTPDSYGDIIEPGAFTETFKKREESGHPFPLCFNHDFSAVIGAVDSVKDTEKGPFITAHFLDTDQAQDVRKMLQSGAIYQFSFAYDILGNRKPTLEEEKAGVFQVLTKLEVFEISVVTVPANQNAVVTEVKAAELEAKAGRRNSKADESVIRDTIDQLNNCIDSLKSLFDEGDGDKPEEQDTEAEKAAPEVNEASEEPEAVSNSSKAAELLEKIKSIKGGSES